MPTTQQSKSKGPYCSQRSNQLREFLVGGSLSALPGRGLTCILTASRGFGAWLQVSFLLIFVRPWQPSQKCRWWDKDAGPPPNIFFCHGYCHRCRQDSFVKGSSQLSFQGSPDCVFIRQEPLQVQARASAPSAHITTAWTPPDVFLVQDYPHCLRVETLRTTQEGVHPNLGA